MKGTIYMVPFFLLFGSNMKDSKQAFILQQNGVKSLV